LIGETVQVWYHESDIRVITLYKNGECLGEAYVSRPWRRYPFPRKTRKIIYELTRAKKLNHKRNDDPFQAYFDYLLAQEGSKDAHRELMRISLEWGTFRSSMDTASIDLIIDDQPTDPKPFKPLIHLGADDD